MRIRRNGPVLRLAVPMLVTGFAGQVVGLAGRIGASYQALEMGLSPFAVLLLASVFSFPPIFLAMGIGRFSDRKGSGQVVFTGAMLLLVGTLIPLVFPGVLAMLGLSMALLGIGQTLQIAAIQAEISMFGRPRQRDRMIGSFMVYQSLGQVMAPLPLAATSVLPLLKPQTGMFVFALAMAVVIAVSSLPILRHARRPLPGPPPVPVRTIVGTPGLVWLAVSGCLCVAAQDITYVFIPIVAADRGIDPAAVGVILGAYAVSQLLARAVYARAVQQFGRMRLMAVSILVTAVCVAAVALPTGAAVMAVLLFAAGLTQGFAVTSSVSLTMQLAPRRAKATTLSLRLAVNRSGQFAMPLLSGLATPWLGPGGVFLTSGLLIGLSLPFLPIPLRSLR